MLESLPSESRRLGNIQRKTIPHQSFSLNHPGKRCLSLKPNHFPRLNLRRGSLHPLRSKEIQSPKLCTSHQHLTTTPPKKKKKKTKPNQTHRVIFTPHPSCAFGSAGERGQLLARRKPRARRIPGEPVRHLHSRRHCIRQHRSTDGI